MPQAPDASAVLIALIGAVSSLLAAVVAGLTAYLVARVSLELRQVHHVVNSRTDALLAELAEVRALYNQQLGRDETRE
jgi:hypothetical protein